MPIELKMPALSPTMEEGTLAKWLVKEGDSVASGDLIAEIETDKATMEFEAVDEGTIAKIVIPEGTDNVKVGAVIAIIAGEDEDAGAAATSAPAPAPAPTAAPAAAPAAKASEPTPAPAPAASPAPAAAGGERIKASPLARRIAAQNGLDLGAIQGSGPGGRIVKADVADAKPGAAPAAPAASPAPAPAASAAAPPAPAPAAAAAPFETDIPHEAIKLSNMRKTIARRLTQSKQEVPHYRLTLDCNLDALMKLRAQLNAGLEARGVKLSVNDFLIKALGLALEQVPDANVSFAGDTLIRYQRADISMAVAIEGGLITPVITDVGAKTLSKIATEAKTLAGKARDGKLQPHEYQGGTASISNLGMFGIKQFDAVINPPQAMIMAIGAGDKRAVVIDDALQIATVMTASGSFDHRAIDGAVGSQLMQAFQQLVENPIALVA